MFTKVFNFEEEITVYAYPCTAVTFSVSECDLVTSNFTQDADGFVNYLIRVDGPKQHMVQVREINNDQLEMMDIVSIDQDAEWLPAHMWNKSHGIKVGIKII